MSDIAIDNSLTQSTGYRSHKVLWLAKFITMWRVVAVAALFALPALRGGYIQDDNFFLLRYFFPNEAPEFRPSLSSPFGFFTLADGTAEHARELVEKGIAPWWIDLNFKFKLFRPLAEWSHSLDFALWPHNTFLIHLHSLLWFLVAVYAASSLYRRLLGATPVAGLAALLFCLDSNFAWANGWIASRNTLMCLTFGLLALNCFLAARNGRLWLYPVSIFFFSCGLLSGEFALSSFTWILCAMWLIPLERKSKSAFALEREEGVYKNVAFIFPYLFVLILWVILYIDGGHGVTGSADYLSPATEPFRFLMHLFSQAPDIWFQEIYFFAYTLPGPAPVLSTGWLMGLIGIALFFYFSARTTIPHRAFWLLGALAASLPASAGSGGSRVAMFILFGLAPMLAAVILQGFKTIASTPQRYYSWFLMCAKILMLPLTLAAPILLNQFDVENVAAPAKQIDIQPADKDKRLIILNPLHEPASRLFGISRLWQGLAVTHSQLSLANGAAPITVERPTPYSLLLSPEQGFAVTPGERFMRNIVENPFRVGDTLFFSYFRIRVEAITDDGRPAKIRVDFDEPLESKTYLWYQCNAGTLTPWQPIALYSATLLAACRP